MRSLERSESPKRIEAPRELAWIPPILIVSAWVLLPSAFGLISPILSLAASAMLLRRSLKKAALALVLSPLILLPALAFFWGIGTYLTGTASMWGVGLMRNPGGDLETGFPWRTSGCMVYGHELLWQPPNNGGVRLMTWLCGRR